MYNPLDTAPKQLWRQAQQLREKKQRSLSKGSSASTVQCTATSFQWKAWCCCCKRLCCGSGHWLLGFCTLSFTWCLCKSKLYLVCKRERRDQDIWILQALCSTDELGFCLTPKNVVGVVVVFFPKKKKRKKKKVISLKTAFKSWWWWVWWWSSGKHPDWRSRGPGFESHVRHLFFKKKKKKNQFKNCF